MVCREVAWRAFGPQDLAACELDQDQQRKLLDAIEGLKAEHAAGGCPCSVVSPEGKPLEFTFFRPQQYGAGYEIRQWPSFCEMLEGYYAEKDRAERLRTKSKELHKAVHNMYERAVRKQAARKEELAASEKSEQLRLYGELLSANLYQAQKGMKSITVPNWYDEGKEVTIPLDARYSPSQNAQNFFKAYKKKQTAARMLVDLLAEGEKEIAYLETVLYEVESAPGEAALNEIRGRAQEPGLPEVLQAAGQKTEARRLLPVSVVGRVRDPGGPQQHPERAADPPHRPGQGPVVPHQERPRQPHGGDEQRQGHPPTAPGKRPPSWRCSIPARPRGSRWRWTTPR